MVETSLLIVLFLGSMFIILHFFFNKYQILKIICLFLLIIYFIYSFKKSYPSFISVLNSHLYLSISDNIYDFLLNFILLTIIIIKAPYLRITFNNWGKYWNNKKRNIFMGGSRTQKEILEVIVELSRQKIGALITIEKNNTLEQYAQKAILINGDVSKELLLNIFTINTPLHDGAVIIRGDKILCAGAYFTLSSVYENFEKKTGSRHRAALGISELTDSMTIVVSEETGNISIALESIMIKINEKAKLQEYLNIFMN